LSQEGIKIVRRAVALLQDGDPRDVFTEGLAAPDARWHPAKEFDAGTYVGAEGFAEFMGTWTEAFDDWTIRVTEWRDVGDRVLVLAQQEAVGKGSGIRVKMDFGMVFELRDGRIAETRVFLDRHQALQAAGLAE